VGCAKGAGMIHPNMATMLAFVTTDAAIAPSLLQKTLREVAGRTFNAISVDGDTSTNDTLLVLANGEAGAPSIKAGTSAHRAFAAALENLCRSLGLQIVADGEGASRQQQPSRRARSAGCGPARGQSQSPLLDLRLHRGIRADQRKLSHLDSCWERLRHGNIQNKGNATVRQPHSIRGMEVPDSYITINI